MIIDVHTHAFPAPAVADPDGWSRRAGENHWRRLVLPAEGRPSLQGWVEQGEFLVGMDRNRIDHCVLLGWYWENPDSCDIQNREMARWTEERPDRFSAFAAVHPDGGTPAEWIDRALSAGFRGFGELLPAVQGRPLADPFWDELAEGAAEAGLAFNFHVSEPVGRPHPGRVATPFEEFQLFVDRHPGLTTILSHWGGGLFLSELNPFVRKRFANVYYDCSASPLLYDRKIFEIAVRAVGAEKILFGSDYPLRLYPRQERSPGWKRFLAEIEGAGLSPADRRKLLGENARRVLRLP